jgi:Holliday junction resolvasome RuvABC endonuclease subunit
MPIKLLAIDPSLTRCGWALFDCENAQPLLCDILDPPGTELALSVRYDILQQQVSELVDGLELSSGDFLITEGPAPLVKNPESALRVERVRSIFEAVGRSYSLRVAPRLNPRTVQSELLGLKGKQLPRKVVKEIAHETARQLYPNFFTERKLSQDAVDALLIGSLAVARVQLHLKTGVELSSLFQPKPARGSRERFSGWR